LNAVVARDAEFLGRDGNAGFGNPQADRAAHLLAADAERFIEDGIRVDLGVGLGGRPRLLLLLLFLSPSGGAYQGQGHEHDSTGQENLPGRALRTRNHDISSCCKGERQWCYGSPKGFAESVMHTAKRQCRWEMEPSLYQLHIDPITAAPR